jgi:diguanylate cyclase (GGDEF)-like protein
VTRPERSRRTSDGRLIHVAFLKSIAWMGARWSPQLGGRLLLVIAIAVTTITAPAADPDSAGAEVLVEVVATFLALLIASFVVPWSHLTRRATLAFPLVICASLAALGLGADGLGANFTGLIALSFAYVGLTQTSAACVKLLPIGIAAYICANDAWSLPLAGRLAIAIAAWLLIGIVFAELIAYQAVLTAKLRAAAHIDALTGVANRRDLEHRLTTVEPGDTLVICDLDHFKRLNATRGHAAGDRILAEFGMVLMTCLRESDYAARYGGEEFALILPASDDRAATDTLKRIRERWAVLEPDVTFSAGIATCYPDRPASQTLAAADRSMYAAKAAGRNRDQTSVSLPRR